MSKNSSTKYQTLRANLIKRGWTIRSWAIQHGYAPPTAYNAARRTRRGVKSQKILTELQNTAYAV